MITITHWKKLNRQQKRKKIMDTGDIDRVDVANNLLIFDKFISEAHKVCTREHYSARTIVEYIRHNTQLQSDDKLFKINNNLTPKMARISMVVFPRLNGLFETRGNK